MYKIRNLLLILAVFLLVSCLDNKDENIWVVGTCADNPPYEFVQNGEILGFDIDLITEVSKYLGKKVQFKNMPYRNSKAKKRFI